MSEKFKISGVGIDTETIMYEPGIDLEDNYKYVHTSISKNNDFIISSYVKSHDDCSLITTIDFTEGVEEVLGGHLLEIGLDLIDLLLIDSPTFDWSKAGDFIKELSESGVANSLGIRNPKSIEDLEKMKESLDMQDTLYVALDICPLNFNYEIVEWCKSNGVTLIGFNPFGGNITAQALIESFTTPYLLSFAATYCSLVMLSGRDLYLSGQSKLFLEGLIGKETSPIYTLRKSVSRLYKPIKKVVSTSLKFADNMVLEYDCPEIMYDQDECEMKLGKSVTILPDINKDLYTNTETLVTQLLDVLSYPENASVDVWYALARYKVLSHIRYLYPPTDGWIMKCARIGDRILGIGVSKIKKNPWYKKIKSGEYYDEENHSFILAMPPYKEHKIFLQDMSSDKNSSQKP